MRYLLLLPLLLLIACSDTPSAEATEETTSTSDVETTAPPTETAPSTQEGTVLCKINGEPWAYTKGSGIVSRDKKTGKSTAIFTFTRKVNKGKESVQLYYDGDDLQLETCSLILKMPKAGGELFTAHYTINPDIRDKYPDTEVAGTIELSNPTVASGSAEVNNIHIRWEKENLANPEDATVSVTDLQFSGIGYSDLNKAAKKLGY